MIHRLTLSIAGLIAILLTTGNTNAYQITFHPRVTFTAEYTDNRELASQEEIDDLDEDPEEIITTVSPGFALAVIGQTQGLTLDYAPLYRWYQENQEDNTLGHSANLEIYKQATRNTSLYIEDAFRYTDDPTIEQIDGEQVDREGRDPYYTNQTTVGIDHQFGPTDIFTLAYNYNILENEEDALDDSIEQNPIAALTYYPFSNTGIDLSFSFTLGEFDNDDNDVEPSDDFENYFGSLRLIQRLSRTSSVFIAYDRTLMDYDEEEAANYELHYPNAGLSYQFEDSTDITIGAGYLVTDRNLEPDEDDERFLANADITRIWPFQTAALTITGSSGYDESFFDEENLGLQIYHEAGANFTHEFLRLISYELNAGYRVDQYINTDPEREDRTKTAGVGFVFTRIEYMTARIDYEYRDVESHEEEDEYTENSVSFTITVTPRNPIYLKR